MTTQRGLNSGSSDILPLGRVSVRGKGKSRGELVGLPLAVIEGYGSVISTGSQMFIEAPFDGTLVSVRAFADQTGSIVVDVWKDAFANFPPTNADTITAGNEISISSGRTYENVILAGSGWTVEFSRGDIFYFNVDSVATIKKLDILMAARRR